jgi:hypothetical protein
MVASFHSRRRRKGDMRFSVLKAFAATFAYLARHWLLLLKAMWLPALLVAGLQLYAAPALLGAMAEFVLLGPNPDPEVAAAAFSHLAGAMIFYLLAGFVFFPMLAVASLRHIIRGEETRLPFYFNYGADETRIMGANFLFNLMVVVIAVVADLAIGVVLAVASIAGPAAGGAVRSVGGLLSQAATGWFQVRLSTLFPAVMATRTLGLGVAWTATKRDWPALIAFWILIGIVIAPAIFILLLPAGLALAGDIGAIQSGDKAAIAAFFQKLSASLAPAAPGFLMTAAGLVLMTLFVNAVVNVASAVAWRYLAAGRDGAADAS